MVTSSAVIETPNTDDARVDLPTALSRLGGEVSLALDLATELEHAISVFSESAGLDAERHFQSVDLIVQMLTNIRKVMAAVATEHPGNATISLSAVTRDVNLRDMVDRLQGVVATEIDFDSGDLDLF